MADRFDLVVVGLGSAGIIAARLAAAVGLRVCGIERARVGGDCLWTGCVPSKTLIASARAAHAVRTAPGLGIDAGEPRVDAQRVFGRIDRVRDAIAAAEDDPDRLREIGVDVRLGEGARLLTPHRVRIGAAVVEARNILLCTGSRPAVPEIPGIRDVPFLTSETFWDSGALPRSLLLLGGGPIAAELGQALSRLGVEVTILTRDPRLLPREEPELAAALRARLEAEGVHIETGTTVERIGRDGESVTAHAGGRTWTAERLFVGAGRRPNVEGLGLETLGIATTPRGVQVDARSRTSISSVYAVGDLAGREHFTHSAAQEAARALQDMAYPGRARFRQVVPWVTFTDPELAHVGLTTVEARERHGRRARTWRIDLGATDRARADGTTGALVAITHRERLVGAHVLAPAAGELAGELALAVHRRMRLRDLSGVIHPYPTLATGIALLASQPAVERARRHAWLVRR